MKSRPIQVAVIALFASIIVACAIFGPLYARGVEQASVSTLLTAQPVSGTGIRLVSESSDSADKVMSTTDMAQLLPPDLRRVYPTSTGSRSSNFFTVEPGQLRHSGTMMWRADACQHLELATGRCAEASREVVITAADARNYGWKLDRTWLLARSSGNTARLGHLWQRDEP